MARGPPADQGDVPLIGGEEDSAASRLREARIFLEDGQHNQRLVAHPRTPSQRRFYSVIHHTVWFAPLDFSMGCLLLLLAIFEQPAVWAMPRAATASIEGACLAFQFVFLVLQAKRFGGLGPFLRPKTGGFIILPVTILAACGWLLNLAGVPHMSVLRVLRPVFLLRTDYASGVRRALRAIIQSLGPILEIMVLLVFIICVFAVTGVLLFRGKLEPGAPDYFPNFVTAFVNMFVLMTTANYPDIMMPAYGHHRSAAIFFWFYLLLVLYFVQNFLLAVVYQNYTIRAKHKFRKLFLHRRDSLRNAFNSVCNRDSRRLDYPTFQALMGLYRKSWEEEHVFLTFKALSAPGQDELTVGDFLELYSAIELEWWLDKTVVRPHEASGLRRLLKQMVMHPLYEVVVQATVVANSVYFFIAASAPAAFYDGQIKLWSNLPVYQLLFLVVYAGDLLIKLSALGPRLYFEDVWNRFDCLITVVAILGQTLEAFENWAVLFVTLRPFRLLRLLKLRKVYRDLTLCLVDVFPKMGEFIAVLLAVFFVYSIVGMEVFADTVIHCTEARCGDEYTNSTLYGLNNFDDIFRSYNTLFEMMIVNNWHITMEGHVAMTNDGARVFFMLFYLTVVLVVCNVIVAFILDAFMTTLPLLSRKEREGRMHDRMGGMGQGLFPEHNRRVEVSPDEVLEHCTRGTLERIASVDRSAVFNGVQGLSSYILSRTMYKAQLQEWVASDNEEHRLELRGMLPGEAIRLDGRGSTSLQRRDLSDSDDDLLS